MHDTDHRVGDPGDRARRRRPFLEVDDHEVVSPSRCGDDVEHILRAHLRRRDRARVAGDGTEAHDTAVDHGDDAVVEGAEAVRARVDRGAEVGLEAQAQAPRDRGRSLVGVDEQDGAATFRQGDRHAERDLGDPAPSRPGHRDDGARRFVVGRRRS